MKNLSIIIPVYNTSRFLRTCLNSLLPIIEKMSAEVIFVNDGSTDDSLNVLRQFENDYDFVKIISQSNQGLSAARNNGINNAKGNYFLLLDSDDWLESDAVIKIYNLATEEDLDLVGFQLRFVDENFVRGDTCNKQLVPFEKNTTGKLALINGFQPSSACQFIYKISFIKENNLNFFKGIMQEDVEFTVRLLIAAERVYFTDLIAYNYYRRSDSMTTTLSKSRVEKYLRDSILVAEQIKLNLNDISEEKLIIAVEENFNSVVWNLIWRFLIHRKEVSYQFKLQCLQELKLKALYPIKGALKTSFQNKTRLVFNFEPIFKMILKARS